MHKAMKLTYKQARCELFTKLESQGWVINAALKVPTGTHPELHKDDRIFFKTQAIYKGHGRPMQSLHLDIKSVNLNSAETISNALIAELTQ